MTRTHEKQQLKASGAAGWIFTIQHPTTSQTRFFWKLTSKLRTPALLSLSMLSSIWLVDYSIPVQRLIFFCLAIATNMHTDKLQSLARKPPAIINYNKRGGSEVATLIQKLDQSRKISMTSLQYHKKVVTWNNSFLQKLGKTRSQNFPRSVNLLSNLHNVFTSVSVCVYISFNLEIMQWSEEKSWRWQKLRFKSLTVHSLSSLAFENFVWTLNRQ